MKTSIRKYERRILTTLLIISIGISLFLGFTFSAKTYPPDLYLDDLPATTSFVVNTNGTTYWATSDDGQILYPSTNASYVCEQVFDDNRLVHFRAGDYSIDYDVLATHDNFYVEGDGAGATTFLIGTNGGFTCSKDVGEVFIDNVGFKDLKFDGQGVAMYGIRSRSDAGGGSGNLILRGFETTDCVFTGFTASGSHALDMANLEEAWITKNIFFGTTGVNIYLWQDGTYESGNIHIEDNWICVGYGSANDTVGILINSTGIDPLGDHGCGGVWIEENHFLGVGVDSPLHGVAVKLVSHNASCSHNKIINNRMEGCDIFHSVSSASYVAKYNVVADNNCVNNKGIQIWLDQFTRNGEVHGNTISNSNSSAYCIIDEASLYTSSENKIYDNFFFSNAQFSLTPLTIVYDNYKLNPLGVKSTNYRYGASMSYYGTDSNWANGTIYTVRNTDMLLTLVGGSGLNVTVWDNDSNVVAKNMTSAIMLFIPHLYLFSVTYTTVPTATFAWT